MTPQPSEQPGPISELVTLMLLNWGPEREEGAASRLADIIIREVLAAAPDPVASPPEAVRLLRELVAEAALAPGVLKLRALDEARRFLEGAVASPAPLDVERLARAIDVAWDSEIHQPLHSVAQGRGYVQLRPAPGLPARIAAAYARLEGQPVAEEPG